MHPIITPDYIKNLLLTRDDAVGRAMIALYNRQTADERAVGSTRHSNGRGFSSSDARLGSYYACWVLGGRHLTGIHLQRARTMSLKYIRQLHDEALLKSAKQR